MESILKRIGLYDFFAILLSGMIFLIMSIYLEIPIYNFNLFINSEFLNCVIFVLFSYFVGLIFQEIGSLIDKNIPLFKFREKARSNFLNVGNNVTKNPIELHDFQKVAKNILHLDKEHTIYSAVECEYVYYYCKKKLELCASSDKIDRLNSIYGMSRSLLVAVFFVLITYFICFCRNFIYLNILKIIIMVVFIFLFGYRCKRFAEYKVREVLYEYCNLV